MFSYNFNTKKNYNKIIAQYLYTELISINKLIISKCRFDNKNDFNLAFEINSLLLFCFFFGCKQNQIKNNKNISQELMNIFINDLDHSFRTRGIGDMSIGKYVKKTVKKFYFRVKKLDVIFQNNNIEEFYDYLQNLNLLNKSVSNDKNINYLFENCKELIVRLRKSEINKSILNKLFI